MISKNTSLLSPNKYLFFFMLLVLPSTVSLFAQTIAPQQLPFNKICAGGPHPDNAGQIFNEYQAFFKINGFDPSVTFEVELSDSSGSFATPTATTTLPPLNGTPPDTATDKTITFAVPTNLVGSNLYQLRVKPSVGTPSSSFTILGTVSTKSFSAYFKAYNGPFFINNKNSSISFCSGGSITLTIDNPTPSIPDSSPANYPELKYNWYKDDVLIAGQTASSLVVNSAGVYYAQLDYGLCSEVNSSSQRVTIGDSSGSSATIASSAGNPFCSSSGNTTLSVSAGNSYVWKKDNSVVSGATAQTYQTNLPGSYTCDVDFGGCFSTASIDLKVLSSTISVPQMNFIEQDETLVVTTTTNMVNPLYQWFLSDIAISGATQSSLDVTAIGKYKVIITQTVGCTNEFVFEVAYKVNYNVGENITNILTPNNDGTNDTWIIPDKYTIAYPLHLKEPVQVMILNSYGEIVFQTDNYDNYAGWPQTAIDFKNFNPVYYYIITPTGQSAKKGSITVLK